MQKKTQRYLEWLWVNNTCTIYSFFFFYNFIIFFLYRRLSMDTKLRLHFFLENANTKNEIVWIFHFSRDFSTFLVRILSLATLWTKFGPKMSRNLSKNEKSLQFRFLYWHFLKRSTKIDIFDIKKYIYEYFCQLVHAKSDNFCVKNYLQILLN